MDVSDRVQVDVVRTLSEFAEMEGAWTAALQGEPAWTIHVSHPWLRAWWQTYGADHEMRVMVARSDDRVLGMAPLMIERRTFRWAKVPVLRLIGNDISPRSDIILLDRHAEVMQAFVRTMLTLPWVYFDFGQVPKGSGAVPLLESHVGGAFASMRRRNTYETPLVSLEGGWPDYLATKSQNFRRSLRRAVRKAGEHSVRGFPEDFHHFEHLVEDVRRVSLETWAQREGTSLAARRRDGEFYERVMRDAHHGGRLTVMFLDEPTGPVAFSILIGHAGVLYGLKMGYRESRAGSEPGLNLMAACLEREFGRQRWQTLDLDCATAHSDWKHRWATRSEEVVSYYVFRRTALSRAADGLYRCKKWKERPRTTADGAVGEAVDVVAGGSTSVGGDGAAGMEGPR
jgi:hypothetical protein